MLDTRKLPRRSMSLLDRLNKSDAEEKSLSNDESPLPSCPRQPPDGVETPSEAIEKVPDLPSRLPPRISTSWCNTRPRYSYSSRSQDARSEASVKDKIAMFSVETSTLSEKSDKCNTLPSRSHSTVRKNIYVTPCKATYSEIASLDRRLTKSQDNLDEDSPVFKRQSGRPEALGALTNNLENKAYMKSANNIKPMFYGSTTTLQSDISIARPIYHARSISDDNSKDKVASFKSNLDYLIEQRKKSMSKLRGLVIPEMRATVVDLPEIKVQDAYSKSYFQNSTSTESRKEKKPVDSSGFSLNESKWKTNFIPNNLPKYSPAFKRKSLQIYSSLSKECSPEWKLLEKTDGHSKITSLPSTNMNYPKTPISNQLYNKEYQKSSFNNNMHEFKNVEIKVCTATDIVDSDNDSAMSSTQSSYRSSASSPMQTIETVESDNSRLSPRLSNYASYSFIKHEIPHKNAMTEKNCHEYVKRNICRSVSSDTNISLSSSAGSAATSGSQASCSSLESSVADSDKRRVPKGHDIDTINRRNILASAKCRSGRDAKLNSPVLEAKFIHESYNRSPSPTIESSERLSTLTSAVSAIANKGEIRRRNMIVVETDSDTGSEKNVRLRKQEYKNTRLKRNSSSSSKQKIETNHENGKTDDTLSTYIIKDKEDKEIANKKSGKVVSKNDVVSINNSKSTNKSEVDKENNKTIPLLSEQNGLNTRLPVTGDSRTNSKYFDSLSKITNKNECLESLTQVFRLRKGVGAGIGLILAGGIDCEAKDVTVHRVLADSIAAKAGIKRGSKVVSINGSPMIGLSHAKSVSILKEHRAEVIIEIENEPNEKDISTDSCAKGAETKLSEANKTKNGANSTRSVVTVFLEKAGGGAGLGFGLDGGRDSPLGDRPLTIKKLFSGGAAAQSGRVVVGAELLSAGGQSMEGFTRTQAWAALKALPAGPVPLVLRNPNKVDS